MLELYFTMSRDGSRFFIPSQTATELDCLAIELTRTFLLLYFF